MQLTRRDAVVALLAGGGAGAVAAGVSGSIPERLTQRDIPKELTNSAMDTIVAVAEVVYPSAVSGTEEFVREYTSGLSDQRARTVASTADELDAYTRQTRGGAFAGLSVTDRDSVLRAMGVDRTGSSPEGSLPERVRYYLVNQVLYGLYTSPIGSQLLGIENPMGYPGGYESYQKPPSQDAVGANPDE